jgi:hypothetical protein
MNKLIKLSDTHYIVVDDSEIKESDLCYDKEGNRGYNNIKYVVKCLRTDVNSYWNKHCKKITHSTQPLDTIILKNRNRSQAVGNHYGSIGNISLSEVEEAIYGYSVEKMAHNYSAKEYPSNLYTVDVGMPARGTAFRGFFEGFKAHQELTKDKNKEVIELLTNITEWSSFKEHPIGKQAQRALDILLPKTEWDVEFDEQGKIKLL